MRHAAKLDAMKLLLAEQSYIRSAYVRNAGVSTARPRMALTLHAPVIRLILERATLAKQDTRSTTLYVQVLFGPDT